MLPLVLLTFAANGLIPGVSLNFKDFEFYFQQYFAGALVFLTMRLWIIGHEITQALNIFCFDIVHKRKKDKMI